ncbi:MAG TPA: hypothetical protein VE690_07725 [Rhodopila sp.]|nr:hypothetical protein [Rhodopila sp.]
MTVDVIRPPSDLLASRNIVLQKGLAALRRYNLLLPTLLNQKRMNRGYLLDRSAVRAMDEAYFAFVAYIFHKSPAVRKERGQRKWHSAVELCKQLDRHATFFGIRFLRGEFSDKAEHNYWLERVNPAGFEFGDTVDNFTWWIGHAKNKLGFTPERAEAASLVVTYMDEQGRQACEVSFAAAAKNGNTISVDGQLVDTTGSAGAYTGLGNTWIYVCSARTNKIYTAKSVEGHRHHSSFLGGEPVICAGDWCVLEGQVLYVNTGSGHYRPTGYNMELFAQKFEALWSDRTLVQPEHKGKIMRMRDFIRNGNQAKAISSDELQGVADGLNTRLSNLIDL